MAAHNNHTHFIKMGPYNVSAFMRGRYWTVVAKNGSESNFMANGKSLGNAIKAVQRTIRKQFPARDISLTALDY